MNSMILTGSIQAFDFTMKKKEKNKYSPFRAQEEHRKFGFLSPVIEVSYALRTANTLTPPVTEQLYTQIQ